MNPITRRHLLRTTALVPVVAIAACAGFSPVISIVTDPKVGALIAALQPWIDGLGVLPSWLTNVASAGTVSKITDLIGQLTALAGQIGGVTSIGSAVPLLGNLSTIFGDILAVLPAGTLPANVVSLLTAAETYLPTILAVAGLFAQRAPRFAAMAPMTTAQALSILQAAAASR